MRIQDLEHITGLERPTIRYYEKEGLIAPKRSENGYRSYSDTDANHLKKIKLLRQLGMSIDKIKALQRGTEDFLQAMDEHIQSLSAQIAQDKRAQKVCSAIRSDGVDYASMDAAYYLMLLQEVEREEPGIVPAFHENVPEEIHPWKRYAARTMDYFLLGAIVNFLLFFVFRIRPAPGNFITTAIAILVGAIFIPIEAVVLHLWGTTPGKFAMGMRLEWKEGGNLPFDAALERAKRVYISGMGLRISFVELVLNIRSYCTLTGRSFWRWTRYNEVDPPYDMAWDEVTDIHYNEWEGKRKVVLTALLALGILLTVLTANDLVKPRFRGDELTVEQFAVNYNNTLSILNNEHDYYDKLQPDGSCTPIPSNVAYFNVGGTPEKVRGEFSYQTSGDVLEAVFYENSWSDVVFITPIGTSCMTAAVSLLLAQDGCGWQELNEFIAIWEQEQDKANTSFQYKNLEIKWSIDANNCDNMNGMFVSTGENEGTLALKFSITILDNT